MQKFNCDQPKSKGGINYLDLVELAKQTGIAVPPKILKRDLCRLINDESAAIFYAPSSLHETIKSTKDKGEQSTAQKDVEKLPKLDSLYNVVKVLGAGSFGKVLKAVDKKTGESVALKLLHSLTDSSKREVAILINVSKIYHNSCYVNTLCYKDQFAALYDENGVERRFEVIVTQFVNGVSLDKWIETHQTPSVAQVKKWTRELFNALNICHKHGISHMDVKPANVMIENGTDKLVLIDFGISCNENATNSQVDNCNNQGGGTLVYMSPDYLEKCYLPPGITKDCDESVRQNTDRWAAALTMLDALKNNQYALAILDIGEKLNMDTKPRENGKQFIKELREYVSNHQPSTGDKALDGILTHNLKSGGL